MKTIEVMGTEIKITVTNAEEMYIMFHRLYAYTGLKVDNDEYPYNPLHGYTRGYFQKKYFENK